LVVVEAGRRTTRALRTEWAVSENAESNTTYELGLKLNNCEINGSSIVYAAGYGILKLL
jgi:hypothetical protein